MPPDIGKDRTQRLECTNGIVMHYQSLFTVMGVTVLNRFGGGTNGAGRQGRRTAKTLLLHHYILSTTFL
ncbi:MAG: hypothetical protein KME42_23710 [Tildeniella nuda ZEHNDER 1965/U140]|nr:hypothetical protein [Tildeniella nuda ZEHNDER 1965/U140]